MDKINDTTFKQEVKDDPKDRIEVEVGDSKQPDFKPQVKIMRWDNEVNFSMRAEEKVGATVEEKDGKIKYITPEYEVHQYEKPEASDEGGFEFEWVLKEKPSTNILTATIQTKGLDFFYQSPLTQEEIDQGNQRPENVVGSYAVYHSTKGGMNDAAGMEYKVGKAFHIYRPEAVDADGKRTWCDLNIESDLTVTIPQKFLDDATYPVIVDPTFGYTSVGVSSQSYAAYFSPNRYYDRYGNQYTAPETGAISAIRVHVRGTIAMSVDTFVAVNQKDSIGADSHGQICSGEILDLSLTTVSKWVDYGVSGDVVSGTVYILNIVGNALDIATTGNGAQVMYDTVTLSDYDELFTDTGYAASKEDPWTDSATAVNRRNSIFATYGTATISTNFYLKQGFQ